MANVIVKSEWLTAIANAIRSKTNTSQQIKPKDFADKLEIPYEDGGTARTWDYGYHPFGINEHIILDEKTYKKQVKVGFKAQPASAYIGGVFLSWGDATTTIVVAVDGRGYSYATHKYQAPGEYTISGYIDKSVVEPTPDTTGVLKSTVRLINV